MRRLTFFFFCFSLALLQASPGNAWFGSDKPLVAINGIEYRAEDFKNWWQNWQEKDQPLPETLDPFIEWQLMAREAKRMELYNTPTYQRKIAVFLSVRSLMLLKYEEIDSKIVVDEQAIRQEYESSYTPRQMVQIFFFAEETPAKAAYDNLQNGTSAPAALKELAPADGGPTHYQEKEMRPINTPADWHDALAACKPDETAPPAPWGNGWVILRKNGPPAAGDDKDYDARKRQIGDALADKQNARLSAELMDRLNQKYNVQVDRELFASLPVDDTPLADDLAGKAIITTNLRTISVAEFMEKLKKEKTFRKDYGFQKEEADALKQRLLNGILSQTLTSWEAQDRHYENKPPLQPVYEFYCQHRLIKELENLLFAPQATTNTQEITEYYQAHLDEFSLPAAVTIATVSGDEATAKKFWTGVITGEDFMALAKKYYGNEPRQQQIPINHLAPELSQAILPLAIGEVSPPFLQKDNTVLVKLFGREKGGPLPLSQVGDNLGKDIIDKKFARLRAEYLDKLKAKSTISVDNTAWQALKKELGEIK
ncbi:MAG: peptidylprolyl isomerase [Desulfobulbaceae bacterium]|nr:peptidylprolyl isomerase [Desulfobulbaceae bacterium]